MRCAAALFCLLIFAGFAGADDVHDIESFADAQTALRTRDPVTRLRGLSWLARRVHDPRAIPLLEAALRDPDPAIRRFACAAIAGNEKVAVAVLIRHVGLDPDASVLAVALELLGKLADPQAAPTVAGFLAHKELSVRTAALAALATLDPRDAHRAARHILQKNPQGDPKWHERAPALLVLARVAPPEEFPAIAKIYVKGGGQTRWLARSCFAKLIAGLKPDDAVAQLSNMLGDQDSRVAASAGKALHDVGESGRAMLLSLLSHESPRVRIAAIAGIYQGEMRSAAPQLKARVRMDPEHAVRWAATQALWGFEDPAADDFVLDAARARNTTVRIGAYRLLEERLRAEYGADMKAWRKALTDWRNQRK